MKPFSMIVNCHVYRGMLLDMRRTYEKREYFFFRNSRSLYSWSSRKRPPSGTGHLREFVLVCDHPVKWLKLVAYERLQHAQFNTCVLKRLTNKGKVVITGKRVNRGAGYGLEIPCKYIFYGDNQAFIPWLKSKLKGLGYDVSTKL